MRSTLRAAAALAVLAGTAALPACRESPTEFEPAPHGEVAFTYSGAVVGTFAAAGQFRGGREPHTYGIGIVVRQQQTTRHVIVGHRVRSATSVDQFLLNVDPALDADVACEPGQAAPCPFGATLFLGIHPGTQANGEVYDLLDGRVEITSRADNRMTGTFSVTLHRILPADPHVVLEVANGTFDVPLVDGTVPS